MKVWIDQDLCTGDGLCEEVAPDVFFGGDDGLYYVREGEKIYAQRALLTEFGRRLEGVRLKTGHGGVFKIRVDKEQVFDRTVDGYDMDAIKESVRQRLDS